MLIHCYFNKHIDNLILIYVQKKGSIVKILVRYLMCHW